MTAAILVATSGPSAAEESATAAGGNEPAATKSSYTEEDLFDFMEEELLVTIGTGMETKLSEVPQAVYVITGEEIRSLPLYNIAEVLRYVPGIIVTTPTAGQWEANARLDTRIPSCTVLLLVDGRSHLMNAVLTDDYFGLPVAPEDIDRVEVMLSPPSVAYGSEALVAVANFITKRPEKEGVALTATGGFSVGDDDVARPGDVHIHGTGTVFMGPLKLRTALGYERLTPWDSQPMLEDSVNVPVESAQRGFGNGRLEIGLGDDASLSILLGASIQERPFAVYAFGLTKQLGDEEYLDATLSLNGLISPEDKLKIRSYLRSKQTNFRFPFTPLLPAIVTLYRQWTYVARTTYEVPLPFSNRMMLGADFSYSFYDFNFLAPGGRERQDFILFIQDEFRPWEDLILTAGLGLNKQNTAYTDVLDRLNLIPRASVVWRFLESHSARFSYSGGLVNSNATSDTVEANIYDGEVSTFLPHEDDLLPAILAHTFEVGYRGRFVSNLQLTLTLSWGTADSRIWLYQVGEETIPAHYVSYPHGYDWWGIDLGSSWQPVSRLMVGLTFGIFRCGFPLPLVLAYGKEPDNDYGGQGSNYYASLSARAYLKPIDDLNITITGLLTTPRETLTPLELEPVHMTGWFYLNVSVGYLIWKEPDIELFVWGTNLTNTRFGGDIGSEHVEAGSSRVGRRFQGGLRVHMY